MLNVSNLAQQRPAQAPTVVSAGNIRSLADRLEHHADAIERLQPDNAADLRVAARLCRHAVRVGWVITSVSVA